MQQNTYYNSLCLTIDEENNVAHKYGMCGVNYHDIGIVYDDEINYNISVLTTYGEEDYESIVRDIHMKIKSLHDTFYNSRKESLDRENRLTEIIESHGIQLKEITETLDRINGKIEKLSEEK